MKKTHIIGIGIIAVAIFVIVSTADDASSYVTFEEAYDMAQNGKDKSIHVVGELTKNVQGEVTGIAHSPDRLSFSFVMVDENDQKQEVRYHEPMPTDFMKSEKVVVIGSYHNNVFVADKILMKCPSKYQETTVSAGV